LFELVGPDAVDKDWTCPACRDICNCSGSNCTRQQHGWTATGALVLQATNGGYASVSHYKVMGEGFDSLVVEFEEVLAASTPAIHRLEGLIEVTDTMKLDTPIPEDCTVRGAVKSKTKEALFCHGATAAEVVARLSSLVDQAQKVINSADGATKPSCNVMATPARQPTVAASQTPNKRTRGATTDKKKNEEEKNDTPKKRGGAKQATKAGGDNKAAAKVAKRRRTGAKEEEPKQDASDPLGIIGRRIKVMWPKPWAGWYEGVVETYKKTSGQYRVLYNEDGELSYDMHNLDKVKYEVVGH